MEQNNIFSDGKYHDIFKYQINTSDANRSISKILETYVIIIKCGKKL